MIDTHIKAKAIHFRQQGLALGEIAERLKLPKTTVYYWIQDIPIARTERQTRAQQIGSQANRDKHARLREAAYNEAYENAAQTLSDQHFRDFIILYMAEGYRRSRNAVSLCNSNPQIIALANHFIVALATNKVGYCLQYYADQETLDLLQFWSDLLKIDPGCIKMLPKSNSGRLSGRNWRCEYGVFDVRASDTLLRARIQAWMDFIHQEWRHGM
jgi:hypothetical protein